MALLKSLNLTDEQMQELIFATRAAAAGMARLWDVVRDLENAHSVTIENVDVDEYVSCVAGELSIPPDASIISKEDVLAYFYSCTKIAG